MRKTVFMLLCFLASMQLVRAQDALESIRQRYASIKKYIETHQGNNPYDGAEWAEFYHLQGQQMLPGTGGHKDDIYMYWDEREEEKIYPSHYLIFATRKYNYSAISYYEEYLYDENGELAFAYIHNPSWSSDGEGEQKEYEFRFYLRKGRLIEAIIKSRDNEQQAYKELYKGPKLPTSYVNVFEEYIHQAEKLKRMFTEIEEVTYDYDE